MLAIDRILEVISNGDWHEIGKITQRLRMAESQVELISSFLATYDFLEFDRKCERIRLSPQLQRFLRKITDIERGEMSKRKPLHAGLVSFIGRWVHSPVSVAVFEISV